MTTTIETSQVATVGATTNTEVQEEKELDLNLNPSTRQKKTLLKVKAKKAAKNDGSVDAVTAAGPCEARAADCATTPSDAFK